MTQIQIELSYGRGSLKLAYDDSRFSFLTTTSQDAFPLSDFEIGAAFDSPIASPRLDEIAEQRRFSADRCV